MSTPTPFFRTPDGIAGRLLGTVRFCAEHAGALSRYVAIFAVLTLVYDLTVPATLASLVTGDASWRSGTVGVTFSLAALLGYSIALMIVPVAVYRYVFLVYAYGSPTVGETLAYAGSRVREIFAYYWDVAVYVAAVPCVVLVLSAIATLLSGVGFFALLLGGLVVGVVLSAWIVTRLVRASMILPLLVARDTYSRKLFLRGITFSGGHWWTIGANIAAAYLIPYILLSLAVGYLSPVTHPVATPPSPIAYLTTTIGSSLTSTASGLTSLSGSLYALDASGGLDLSGSLHASQTLLSQVASSTIGDSIITAVSPSDIRTSLGAWLAVGTGDIIRDIVLDGIVGVWILVYLAALTQWYIYRFRDLFPESFMRG